jgi:hypothetical protein
MEVVIVPLHLAGLVVLAVEQQVLMLVVLLEQEHPVKDLLEVLVLLLELLVAEAGVEQVV